MSGIEFLDVDDAPTGKRIRIKCQCGNKTVEIIMFEREGDATFEFYCVACGARIFQAAGRRNDA